MIVRALDFETVPFGPGNMAPEPVVLSYWDGSRAHLARWDEAEEILEEYLSGDIPVAIANAGYDMAVTMAHYQKLIPWVFDAYSRGIIKDVLTTQKLIDLALGKYRHFGPYSLENLVWRLFKHRMDKDDSPRKDFGRLRHVPMAEWPQRHIDYALSDGEWHAKCYMAQLEGLMEENALEVIDDEDRQNRADLALQLASVWGIRTDAEGIEKLKTASLKRQAEIEPGLLESGLLVKNKKGEVSKNIRKAQQRMFEISGGEHEIKIEFMPYKRKKGGKTIKHYVPTGGWNKIGKLTPKGRKIRAGREPGDWRKIEYVSVDAEACGDSNDDLLLEYTEYSQLGSLLSGHLKAMEEGIVMPIHTRFDILMETGRTSSTNPNIQNVRRKEGARECIVPRKGSCLIGCDYDKAELHTLSQVCINIFGQSKLGEALNSGFDPHTGLGAKFAGVSYEKALELLAAKDEGMKAWRQNGKPFNFGVPGWMQPYGIQALAKKDYGVRLSYEQCVQYYEDYGEQWPWVMEYLQWIQNLCIGSGLANIKHFDSNRWRVGIPKTVAANSFFQGMAADGAKRALFEVARRQYSVPSSALFGTRTINFVHDELILESPLDRANDAAWELRDVMVEEFNHYTRDVPVRATPCLMDRWSKNAETLLDENGELLLWKYEAVA